MSVKNCILITCNECNECNEVDINSQSKAFTSLLKEKTDIFIMKLNEIYN